MNESKLLDDDVNIDLQLKRLKNLGDPKQKKDAINLQKVKIILNNFKPEALNYRILSNQYLIEHINRLTKMYQSPDNILTIIDDIIKNTLKVTKEGINAEERPIRYVGNPINWADAVNFSTLFVYSKDFVHLSERLSNFENFTISMNLKEIPMKHFKSK